MSSLDRASKRAHIAAALADPVATVRKHALRGLACERCRATELPVPQVVPELVLVLAHDTSPDVRQGAVPILFGLQARDPRARPALARALSAVLGVPHPRNCRQIPRRPPEGGDS